MALVSQQLLVPDRDANDIVTGWTLRTIEWNDDKEFFGRPAANVTPKALTIDAPWTTNRPYRVVSTP
jgi:hypothetical protein